MPVDLRTLAPIKVINGAALFPDGRAVGYVIGGTPVVDMVAHGRLRQFVRSYHQFLLARDARLHIQTYPTILNMTDEMNDLMACRADAHDEVYEAILVEIAHRLNESAQQGVTRMSMTVWSVDSGGASTLTSFGTPVTRLIRPRLGKRITAVQQATQARRQAPALRKAIGEARTLASALRAVGGYPAPRLMQAEEIVQLCYRAADPKRAERYPLQGALRDRVRSVVQVSSDDEEVWYGTAA